MIPVVLSLQGICSDSGDEESVNQKACTFVRSPLAAPKIKSRSYEYLPTQHQFPTKYLQGERTAQILLSEATVELLTV